MKIARIREKHPWFWTLKEIISERPNLVPAGIGNNESGYDLNVLQRRDSSEGGGCLGESSGMSDGIGMGAEGDDEDADGEDEEIEEETAPKAGKRKHQDLDVDDVGDNKSMKKVIVDDKKPTVPRAGKSTPAEAPTRKKVKTGLERFADIAAREEETTQKALELKKTKFQGETEKAVARVRAQAEIQMNKDRLRAEYAQKKLELDFQLRLQTVQQQMGGRSHSSSTNIYPATQQSFSSFSPHSSHQDTSGFSLSNYNSYSSQASSGWQPDMASLSTQGSSLSSSSLPAASQSTSAFSVWEPTLMEDISKSESLSLTEQLHSNDDIYE